MQAQRADKQITKIARIHLFQKRKKQPQLAAHQHIPQQYAGQQNARRCLQYALTATLRGEYLVTNAHTSNCMTG